MAADSKGFGRRTVALPRIGRLLRDVAGVDGRLGPKGLKVAGFGQRSGCSGTQMPSSHVSILQKWCAMSDHRLETKR